MKALLQSFGFFIIRPFGIYPGSIQEMCPNNSRGCEDVGRVKVVEYMTFIAETSFPLGNEQHFWGF